MDPISVIVAALAAGAEARLTDTTSLAAQDAYRGLRGLVMRRFAGRTLAEAAVVKHEKAPHVWQAPLRAELAAADAGSDEQIVAAAQQLLALLDQAGTRSGKYLLDVQANTVTTPGSGVG